MQRVYYASTNMPGQRVCTIHKSIITYFASFFSGSYTKIGHIVIMQAPTYFMEIG